MVGIPFGKWSEYEKSVRPYAAKFYNGEISFEEYKDICNTEWDRFVQKHSVKKGCEDAGI